MTITSASMALGSQAHVSTELLPISSLVVLAELTPTGQKLDSF